MRGRRSHPVPVPCSRPSLASRDVHILFLHSDDGGEVGESYYGFQNLAGACGCFHRFLASGPDRADGAAVPGLKRRGDSIML